MDEGAAGDSGTRVSREQSWGDAETRELVESIATEIAARDDIGCCVIEVVNQGGPDATVAVGGDPNRDDLVTLPVCDQAGEVRAVVRVEPIGAARSHEQQRDHLAHALRLPMLLLLHVLERERFAQNMRMMAVVRRLLHTSDVRHDEDTLLSRAVDELSEVFGATGFEIHVFGGEWTGPLSSGISMEQGDAMVAAAERACADRRVLVLEPGGIRGEAEPRTTEPDLGRMLAETGASTVVLAPIGAAGEALGMMLIARGAEGQRWTDAESEAVLDLGHDLGRAILNARATHRERDLLDQLHWHEQLRDSFLSTITHELKTPLTIIRANAELLDMEDEIPPSVAHRLEAIERGVARMLKMVNALTTLAKVSDPARSPVRVTVDLGSLLQEVLDALEAVARRAGVALEMDETNGTCLVLGDPDQLSSALTNITDNAVKYSDAGDVVRVSLSREGPWLVVTCRDEGLGISEEDQAALFTPFFRSSNPHALARPGTGLGLDIVKGVVERHGGMITVESELGRGTTVRLVLPALDDPPG